MTSPQANAPETGAVRAPRRRAVPAAVTGRGPGAASNRALFLPDFCALPVLFSVVVIGELLAFVLVLASSAAPGGFFQWRELALTSLFVQWVGLSSAALLCGLRGWLRRRSNLGAGIVCHLLVLAVTGIATGLGYWLVQSWLLEVDLLSAVREPSLWFSQIDRGSGIAENPLQLLWRNLSISAIVAAVALRYFFIQHQWRQQIEREAQARFQALQSRIRPHFLFNSMNTIASFTRSQPELAEQVVEDLAELFRVSLADAQVPVALARELELCRQYLRIEGLRLGPRLVVEWDVDGLPGNALLPALTLQPLVENAVYHGVEPAPEGGTIRIAGRTNGAELELTLSNPLPVAEAAARARARPGNQMALDNVRERVQAFFGARSSVETSETGGRFEVAIRFPLTTEIPQPR